MSKANRAGILRHVVTGRRNGTNAGSSLSQGERGRQKSAPARSDASLALGGPRRAGARRALAAIGLALFASSLTATAATTTFIQGRETTDAGNRVAGIAVTLDEVPDITSSTVGGGVFVLDGLLPGSRDRASLTGGGIQDYLGRTFYSGILPVLDQDHLTVDATSLQDWADALDPDGTLDETMGVVFGAVVDSTGAPVSGATVSITPGAGDVFYFDNEGSPDPKAVQTGALGRYLILNVPPGSVAVNAASGGTLIGRAYGRVAANKVTGLPLHPTTTVSGDATDETGTPVSGALVSWDFDADFALFADGAGHYDLPGLAEGLDITLRGSAAGFKPALTFSRRIEELEDPPVVDLRFVSDAAVVSWQTAFLVTQAPSLGMIVGRVVSSEGLPLAGAIVGVEPNVGTIGYFDNSPIPAPAPGATQTSASGLFVIFNVPIGNVILSAVAPGATIRSAVAPSDAGSITSGDLRGVSTITLKGRVRDERLQTDTIGGAVVRVLEYPYLAAIANAGGDYVLPGVPSQELVTLRVDKSGFKTTYSFTDLSPKTDSLCQTEDRTDCTDLFAVSDTSYANLYLEVRQVPNRSRGLLSAAVILTNGVGAIGLESALTPASGAPLYVADRNTQGASIGSSGGVQFFNSIPSLVGMSVFDKRNDEATIRFARIFADAVTLTDRYRLDCDSDDDGSFANLYPCDGARMTSAATDAYFHWRLVGSVIRGQVQISRDPTFATIDLTSAAGGARFTAKKFWHATPSKWKKIKKLGASGTAIYWRVLGRDADNAESTTVPFVFYLP